MRGEDPTGLRLEELVAGIVSQSPSPGAGSVAACVVALAAGLVEMVARRSGQWTEAPGVAAQAEALQARIIPLVQENADAYAAALAALRRPREQGADTPDGELGTRLEQAAAVPLLIGEVGADVAEIASLAATGGDPDVHADAAGAALLAEAATLVAARLVDVNLGIQRDDWRRDHARDAAKRAREASDRAAAAS